MKNILNLLILLLFISCRGQKHIVFTSDLDKFGKMSGFKEALKEVEIIALGENTHGLGDVFKVKTELVKFLHEELGFNVVLFESGFGDGALAMEQFDSLSPTAFTRSFTSNFYYQSEEIKALITYAKTRNKTLAVQGFDCQPKQDYLIQRMAEIVQPIDSVFAKTVGVEMNNFNKLYQYEYTKDSINFYKQRDAFISFLAVYDQTLHTNEGLLLKLGTTKNELTAIKKSNSIFRDTYSTIAYGDLMGWPNSANIRDKALLATVKWYKEQHPKAKIIIWAQNSHIENYPKPNMNVNWMGHGLKKTFGNKYYSIGTFVYSGRNLDYNGTFDFEHTTADYLAYHLNRYGKTPFVMDLRNYTKTDFITQKLLGMESNKAVAEFVVKDRFDGLLFIKYSGIPILLKKE
jgi:erythromycin esterase